MEDRSLRYAVQIDTQGWAVRRRRVLVVSPRVSKFLVASRPDIRETLCRIPKIQEGL
jgi:hypothetical protein